MKISTEIGALSRLVGEEESIRILAAAGFEAWDFSMFSMARYNYSEKCIITGDHPLQIGDFRSYAKHLRKVGEDCGIFCNQSHAPFPTYCPEMLDYLFRAIECTAITGGKICVIHPDNYKGAKENVELYEKLLPFAKDYGVKIAIENTFRLDHENGKVTPAFCSTADGILEIFDFIKDPSFVACLDIGHAEMQDLPTSACDMIRALGKERLACLHVHDNDKCHDSHQLPFSMQIDWESIAAALGEVGYCGEITLECVNYPKAFDADTALECAKNMASAANRFRELILAKKS